MEAPVSGQKLREMHQSKDLSLLGLGAATGLDPQTICRREVAGQITPRSARLPANAIGASPRSSALGTCGEPGSFGLNRKVEEASSPATAFAGSVTTSADSSSAGTAAATPCRRARRSTSPGTSRPRPPG